MDPLQPIMNDLGLIMGAFLLVAFGLIAWAA